MSKKIRVYEKERGGTDVFLSPRHAYGLARPASRKKLASPPARYSMSQPRFVNQSAMNPHIRSFMGEKVV